MNIVMRQACCHVLPRCSANTISPRTGLLLAADASASTAGEAQAEGSLALQAWAMALQLTEDEDDAVRRTVSAALGAAMAADAGVLAAEQVCGVRTSVDGSRSKVRVGCGVQYECTVRG